MMQAPAGTSGIPCSEFFMRPAREEGAGTRAQKSLPWRRREEEVADPCSMGWAGAVFRDEC